MSNLHLLCVAWLVASALSGAGIVLLLRNAPLMGPDDWHERNGARLLREALGEEN